MHASLLRAITGERQAAGRLSEFRLAGKLGPLLATAIVLVGLCVIFGTHTRGVEIFIQLCVAYLIPFAALALLTATRGINAGWRWILPVAIAGVVGGGFASAAITRRDKLETLLDISAVLPDWSVGAAFGAFFVGLSLATTAVRRQEQIEFESKHQLLEARLQTLTARIEPHFLMNTLANLSALVETDARAAHRMLDHLTDLLQAALEHSRDPATSLAQELELIDSYLAIMQMRLADKLRYTVEADATLANVAFPALLLQTLVENAVNHGIEACSSGGTVTVRAVRDDQSAVISVADDGAGFDAASCPEGTGLQNVRDRLGSFYAGGASLAIESTPGSGTVARLTVPLASA